jgi:hypothetical protein
MSAAEIDALAERVLLLNALRGRIDKLERQAKAALAQAIPPGSSVKPLVEGEPLGSVSRTVTNTHATIADEDAFGAWIERHYPQHIQTTRVVVYPAVIRAVLDMSTEAGVPVGPGGECGELAPAGVKITESGGIMRAVPNRDAMPALWARIRERLPELTSGAE